MKTLNQFFIRLQCGDYQAFQNFITEKELDPIQLFKKELNLFLNSNQKFKESKVGRKINVFVDPETKKISEISALLGDYVEGELFKINILDRRELQVFTQDAPY